MLVHKAFGVIVIRGPFLMYIRVFIPSYWNTAISSLHRKFERDKQQMYEQHIRDVEMGSLTPLVFPLGEWVVRLQLRISGKLQLCLLLEPEL